MNLCKRYRSDYFFAALHAAHMATASAASCINSNSRVLALYIASGRDCIWSSTPGEYVEELNGRVEAELRTEGHRIHAICEIYAGT